MYIGSLLWCDLQAYDVTLGRSGTCCSSTGHLYYTCISRTMSIGQPGLWDPCPLRGQNHRDGPPVQHGHVALLVGWEQHDKSGGLRVLCTGIAQLLEQLDLVVTRQQPRVDQQHRPVSPEQG